MLRPSSPSLLHKQNAITILRPIIHYLFHLQPRRAQLLNHNLLRNPVPTPVARNSFHRVQPRARREINNRQPPSRLQRPHQAGVKLHRLGQVMVHVPQENRVTATRRQIRIRLLALHHHHVPQLPFRHFRPQLPQLLRINLRRIHAPRRPPPFHRRKRIRAIPRPNIRPHPPRCPRAWIGLPPHQLRHPPHLPPRLPALPHRAHHLHPTRQ